MFHKKDKIGTTKNYRPLTWHTTIYKTLASIYFLFRIEFPIFSKILHSFTPGNPLRFRDIISMLGLSWLKRKKVATFTFVIYIFPDEQKCCKHGLYGCKNQNLIDKMIVDDVIMCTNPFKRIDRIWKERSRVIHSLETYKFSSVFRNILTHIMKFWKTTFMLKPNINILNINERQY